MEQLGSYLKELREGAVITIEQVYDETRIRKEQIQAIEEGSIRRLGDYGYARAIVSSYARYLNADQEMVMRGFDLCFPEDCKSGYQAPKLPKERKIMLSTNFLWMLVIVTLSLSLAFILFHSYNKGYLKTPEFFQRTNPDSVEVNTPALEAKPDSLRLRLLQIRESLPPENRNQSDPDGSGTIRRNTRDTTDYISLFMGDSPVNIE